MDVNVMSNVSFNMRELRKKLNMSQEEIASKLNIVRPVISNWERGVGEPSTSQLAKLAQVLNVSLDVLVNGENDGKRVAVVDTSMLIKRPAIIKELVEKFDEVIIPEVVIDELNYQKDNARPWLKKQSALIMHYIDDIRDNSKKCFIQPTPSRNSNDQHDVQIANLAIERAKNNFCDKVYVFSNDIWFSFLVKEKRSNLILLSSAEYKTQFIDEENYYNVERTHEFMSLLKNKEWQKVKESMKYDSEIDINYVDPEIGYTPLIQAIRHRKMDIVKSLIETYKTNIDLDGHDHYKYKFTPLLHTSQMGYLEMMKLLVNEGADINVGSKGDIRKGDNVSNTPLMVCAFHGFSEGVKFLIEQGVCFNQQDGKNGFTALMKACMNGHFEIASLLIEGTDIHIRSYENKKAIEYIKPNKKNSEELFKLLKERMNAR